MGRMFRGVCLDGIDGPEVATQMQQAMEGETLYSGLSQYGQPPGTLRGSVSVAWIGNGYYRTQWVENVNGYSTTHTEYSQPGSCTGGTWVADAVSVSWAVVAVWAIAWGAKWTVRFLRQWEGQR